MTFSYANATPMLLCFNIKPHLFYMFSPGVHMAVELLSTENGDIVVVWMEIVSDMKPSFEGFSCTSGFFKDGAFISPASCYDHQRVHYAYARRLAETKLAAISHTVGCH